MLAKNRANRKESVGTSRARKSDTVDQTLKKVEASAKAIEKEEKQIQREIHTEAKEVKKEVQLVKEAVGVVTTAAQISGDCFTPKPPPGLMYCSPEEILWRQEQAWNRSRGITSDQAMLWGQNSKNVDLPFDQFAYRPPTSMFDTMQAFQQANFNATRSYQETYVLTLIPLKRAGFLALNNPVNTSATNPPVVGAVIPPSAVQPLVTAPGAAPPFQNIVGVENNGTGQLQVVVQGRMGNIGGMPWGPQYGPRNELSSEQTTYLTTLATLYHVILSLNLEKMKTEQPLLMKTCTAYTPSQDTIVTLEAKLECLMCFLDPNFKKQNLFTIPLLHQRWMSKNLQLLFYGDVIRNTQGQPQASGNYLVPFNWKHTVYCRMNSEMVTQEVLNLRTEYRYFLASLYSAIWRTWARRVLPSSNNTTIVQRLDLMLAQQEATNFTVRFLETSILSLSCFLQRRGHEMFNTSHWYQKGLKYAALWDAPIRLLLVKYRFFYLV